MYGLLHIVQSYPMSQFGFWPPVLMFDVPALNDKPFQVVQSQTDLCYICATINV